MFVSHAQNGEDIVLWRVLRHVTNGTYVDVGAADPTSSSVTKAFYDRGWSGVNIEPVPSLAAELASTRTRDQTFQCGASDRCEEADFYVVEETGLSTLDGSLVSAIEERGFESKLIRVQLRTLDDILEAAGLDSLPIHFLKVDVEGAEAEALGGLDLERWRPWVLVIEATKPMSSEQSHSEWEGRVLSAGYQFCMFDGLNRFYVSMDHPELVAHASYPVCIFDLPYTSDEYERHVAVLRLEQGSSAVTKLQQEVEIREVYVGEITERIAVIAERLEVATEESRRWRTEVLESRETLRQSRLEANESTVRANEFQALAELRRQQLEMVLRSFSWRMTKPLRLIRWLRRVSGGRQVERSSHKVRAAVTNLLPPRTRPAGIRSAERFADRVAVAAQALGSSVQLGGSLDVALDAFRSAIETSSASVMTQAWLSMVSVVGRYPDEQALDNAARVLRRGGVDALIELMLDDFSRLLSDPTILDSELEIVRDGIFVDVSHTAAHDLHTGIQRVVREFVSRWLHRPNVVLVQWNFSAGSMKRLSGEESERIRNWRNYLHEPGTPVSARALGELTGKTLIPLNGLLVLPELVANPPTCDGYRTLARSGVVRRCSLIGYDTVPMAATETVTDGMTANFGHYLSLVKYSTHLAAISESAASEFRAFGNMLQAQGLSGPEVTARTLPTEPPAVSEADLEQARKEFNLGSLPIVLVIGSHEPRKNHLCVLEAAESMWRNGGEFELVFAGGSGWGGSTFGDYVRALTAKGYPVRVYERVGEQSLWSLYRLAKFSVFPSLLEGYGLPIAESLVSGTPVITSDHGSMAEVGGPGGSVLVNPRDPAQLSAAMTMLLTDDVWRAELVSEALRRVFPTWDGYSDALWADLVGAQDS